MQAIPVVLVACLMATGVASADVTWLGGEGPPFAFLADGSGATRPGDTLTVIVVVGGRYSGDPTAGFHVSIPSAFPLVSGDTIAAGRLSAISGNYTIKLIPRAPGSYEITGRFRVDAGDQRDDAMFLMPVTVSSDTVIAEHSHYTLLETSRKGQRYRYGDWWLVPLDSTETPVVEREIEAHGARPHAASVASSVCRGCTGAWTDSVRFVVVVGPDGSMRDSRVLGGQRGGHAPEVAAVVAAREALRASRFQAARVKGAGVSDWLYVTVPVRHGE
jgi:hypothetical protein